MVVIVDIIVPHSSISLLTKGKFRVSGRRVSSLVCLVGPQVLRWCRVRADGRFREGCVGFCSSFPIRTHREISSNWWQSGS